MNILARRSFLFLLPCALGLGACATRSPAWNESSSVNEVFSTEGALVLFDEGLHRLLFVRSPKAGELAVSAEKVGKNVPVGGISISPDRKRVFVLDRGGENFTREDNERPSLTIFGAQAKSEKATRVELNVPVNGLVLDAKNEWLAVYDADSFVRSPAEFLFLSLDAANLGKKTPELVPKTTRQFGYEILGMEFSPELTLSTGKRRFFAVRSKGDLTLVDMEHLDREEVTIRLPKDEEDVPFAAAEVVFDDGDPENDSDARIGVRLENSSDVMLLELRAPKKDGDEYSVLINIVSVGGLASAIQFVRTDGGLRLAALVPARERAVLIDPTSTATEEVALGAAYSRMQKITDSVGEVPSGGDVALLYGTDTRFGFWALGSTASTPYASVESTAIDFRIKKVLDVPNDTKHGHLKVLVGEADQFFVLDLETHEAAPLVAENEIVPNVEVSPDGAYVWVTEANSSAFSAVDLGNLHPEEIRIEPAISHLADIECEAGGRAVLAYHGFSNGPAVTLYDRKNLSSTKSRYFPFLDLEGLR